MPAIVVFGISPGVAEHEVENLLNEVAALNGVLQAERLTLGVGDVNAVRHCIATIADSIAPDDVIDQIIGLPGIEYAALPADRGFAP